MHVPLADSLCISNDSMVVLPKLHSFKATYWAVELSLLDPAGAERSEDV